MMECLYFVPLYRLGANMRRASAELTQVHRGSETERIDPPRHLWFLTPTLAVRRCFPFLFNTNDHIFHYGGVSIIFG
jgi:hypothetical protein